MRRKREREKDRLTQLNHPLQHLKLSRAAFYKNSSVRLVERQKLRLYLRDFFKNRFLASLDSNRLTLKVVLLYIQYMMKNKADRSRGLLANWQLGLIIWVGESD